MFTVAEKKGDEPIVSIQIQDIAQRMPKNHEYNRAIHSAFKNWTIGEARKVVTYGVNGGIDAGDDYTMNIYLWM